MHHVPQANGGVGGWRAFWAAGSTGALLFVEGGDVRVFPKIGDPNIVP